MASARLLLSSRYTAVETPSTAHVVHRIHAVHVGAGEQPAPEQEDDQELDEDFDLPLEGEEGGPDDEGEGERDESFEDLLTALDEDQEGDPFDDADARDLDTGIELDALDDKGEDGDEHEVDVGPIDEGISFDDRAEDDDHGAEGDGTEDDLDLDGARSDDDGGAEGTSEAPEDEVDESALPELDADEEDEEDDAELAEELLAVAAAATIPWEAMRWAPLDGAGAAVPCHAVAAAGGVVIAVGEVLLIVDDGARAARRATGFAGAVAVAVTDGILLAATARGQLLYGADGAEAAALPGFRARGPVTLAATEGRVWISSDGALLCFSSPHTLAAVREDSVLAIAASGAAVLAITRDESGPALERRRGDDEGSDSLPLGGVARRIVERARGPLQLAAGDGGRAVAITDGARLAISRDGGRSFDAIDVGPIASIAFAGPLAGAPLLALAPPHDGFEATLIQIPERGDPSRVAALPASGQAGASLAWDTSRDCVWVASSAGLTALASARKH
jgi:hypothetical protein